MGHHHSKESKPPTGPPPKKGPKWLQKLLDKARKYVLGDNTTGDSTGRPLTGDDPGAKLLGGYLDNFFSSDRRHGYAGVASGELYAPAPPHLLPGGEAAAAEGLAARWPGVSTPGTFAPAPAIAAGTHFPSGLSSGLGSGIGSGIELGYLDTLPITSTNGPLSALIPLSAVVLALMLAMLAMLRLYVLDPLLLPRVYRAVRAAPANSTRGMSEGSRQALLNHHVALALKAIVIVVGCVPFFAVLAAGKELGAPAYGSWSGGPSAGDVLVVCTQLVCVAYLFEVLCKTRVRLVRLLHHFAAVALAQLVLAANYAWEENPSANAQFMMVLVWGAFEVGDVLTHVALIVCRVFPNRRSMLPSHFLAAAGTIKIISIGIELPISVPLYCAVGHRWSIAMLIAIPLLNFSFIVCKLIGICVVVSMAREERSRCLKARADEEQAGAGANWSTVMGLPPVDVPSTPVTAEKQSSKNRTEELNGQEMR